MIVNPKKNIKLKNRTLYFSPDKDRSHVVFQSPFSYRFRQSKIEGYESRLYWQFKYCQDFDGQVFYYTLTYNNKSIPKHYGIYCFDYEHLRDLFTGGFRKVLLRKYGTSFKYFVGAELGDGKGKRGLHNNPHYHVLFFLENAHCDKFRYIKIDPLEFRHYVRLYWQGFDEDLDGWHSYKDAKYGAVKEGDNFGLVTDFRAVAYCAKYVCKDVGLKMHEEKVERFLRFKYRQELVEGTQVYVDFLHQVLYDMYNVPLNASRSDWLYDDKQLLISLCPVEASKPIYVFGDLPMSDLVVKHFVGYCCANRHLWNDFNVFVNSIVQSRVDEGLTEWRNRFCNKCRISHGVGDYALKTIDKLNPSVCVPSKNGFKKRPIGLYYYRKLYCDVVRPIKKCKVNEKPCSYSPVRILNDAGIEFKVRQLDSQVSSLAALACSQFELLCSDRELFEKMVSSDVNTEVTCSFDSLLKFEISDFVFKHYAYYKLVYENRFFKIPESGIGFDSCFPGLSPVDDYRRFLRASYCFVDRNDIFLDSFLESGCKGYLPYSSHPSFISYSVLFSVFDMCADYFYVQGDDEAQRKAEEIKAIKRFHDQRNLKQFYYGTTVV